MDWTLSEDAAALLKRARTKNGGKIHLLQEDTIVDAGGEIEEDPLMHDRLRRALFELVRVARVRHVEGVLYEVVN